MKIKIDRRFLAMPLVCFACIALYGAAWQKLEAKDSII